MNRTALLMALRELRANGPSETDVGICHNVEQTKAWDDNVDRDEYGDPQEDANDMLADDFAAWPKYSGHTGYPVPDPDFPGKDWAASKKYNSVYKMWGDDSYGALRHELLDWLIARIEAELEEGPSC